MANEMWSVYGMAEDEYIECCRCSEKLENLVSATSCGWKVMILGSALWLLTFLFQIWMPPLTLVEATVGTALWLVGFVNICSMLDSMHPLRNLMDNS
jgi:hypothetical protein